MFADNKKYITLVVVVCLFFTLVIKVAHGQVRVLTPPQGGTGIGSVTAGDIGKCLKVLLNSPFTFELETCGTGGGGGGSPTYIQTNGATQNSGGTTTLNFTSNSFVLTESPADTFTFRISTTTLGLLASSISDFVSTVRSSITESITGLTFTAGDLSVDSGYVIPTTTRETNQDTAFSWGNHASQGYITDGNTNWDNSYGFLTSVDISANTNLTGGDGLTLTNDDMACDTANSSTFGCLSTADYAIFNNKVSSTSIDTSSELAALVTDETGVGSLVFSGSPVFTGGSTFAGIRVTASSTLGYASSTALTNSGNATLGNATSTTLAVTNLNAVSCDVKADTSGSLYCGTDASGAGGTGSNWTIVSGGLRTSTSTDFARAAYLSASSTGATSTFAGRVLIGTSTAYATYGLSALFEIASENSLGDDTPMIMTTSKDTSGGNAEIRFNSPDPDIEFVEIDQATTTGAGKWELEAQGLDFTINSRNTANSSFERNFTISRASTGGQVGLGTQFDTRFNDSKLTIVSTSTLTNVIMVGSTTSSLGEIFRVSRLGSVYQAQNGATTYFGDYGSGNNVRVGEYNASDTDVLALHGASGIVLTGGNVGIGSTTPSKNLSISGDMALSGGFFDTASTSGTRGMVLQTTGTSTRWVATSTLGLGGTGGGTVTSVDMTVPTGLTISGNPVTTSGTLALSYTAGYSLASTSDFARINTAFASATALTATTPLQYANNTGVFSILQSTAAQNGYLASTDWNIFNNKVSSSSIDTSSELAALLTDETGSAGSVVFSNSPTFTGGTTFAGINVTASSTLGYSSSTALTVSNSLDLFGGGAKTTANALCIQLTGSADLCDGGDASGGGGGVSDWKKNTALDAVTPTTTVGIVINASSTIDSLSGTRATITSATSTNLYVSGLATTTSLFAKAINFGSSILALVDRTMTALGIWDFGGADSVELPNGTGPTVDATGETALDTTSDQFVFYGASAKKVLGNGNQYASFTYATSTAWTGTTTIPLGTAYVAETWNGIQCFTDAGTLNVSIYDGTNRMNVNAASTTVGTTVFSTNNTFTAGEKRYADVGTPASSPTKISCTISKSLTSD